MKFKTTLLLLSLSTVCMTTSHAVSVAAVDGTINTGEYAWDTNTDYAPSTWNTDGNSTNETSDGSGGANWDINYMGFDITGNTFSFGVQGGSVLSGENIYSSGGYSQTLWLGDLAIDVNGDSVFDYGITLGVNNGATDFQLYQVDSWSGVNRYSRNPDGSEGHVTDTYKIETVKKSGEIRTIQDVNGDFGEDGSFSVSSDFYNASLAAVKGQYTSGGANDVGYVLEGSFDLSLLSLFDPQSGGKIISYLTMSCVNDEASVHADISPVPVPAAMWLFGSALLGFIGFSRRTSV